MGSFYIYIYLIVLGIILWVQYENPLFDSPFSYKYNAQTNTNTVLLLIICILFIGLRPVDNAFADMVGYYHTYKKLYGVPFYLRLNGNNKIFDQILPLFASCKLPSESYFTFVSTIYFGGIFVACKKMFPNNLLVAFIACLTAFSTFSYGTNGIKAGAAASIFLVALAYNENIWVSIPLALISWGFHHSMSMVLVAYVISYLFKETKWYFFFWIVATLIAIAHISYFQILFAGWTNEKGAGYLLTGKNSFLTGFRPDFILYSVVPIAVGYWLIIKKEIKDYGYELCLRLYLLTNSVWMLCMYASFSNRIAYLSWFLYPIVLIYPFFAIYWSEIQEVYARRVVMYHYVFTLFMEVIYYTLIK